MDSSSPPRAGRAGTVRRMRRTGLLLAVLILIGTVCSSDQTADGQGRSTRTETIRVVNQNLLHGTACAADSNRCDLPGRVALFLRQLAGAGCPEIVAVEEANETTVAALRPGLDRCGYTMVWDEDPGQDREVVLTTLPVRGSERLRLAGPLRSAYRVHLGSPAGPIQLVATHLASSSDNRPCDAATCPPPCRAGDTVQTCQARQVVDTLEADPPGPHTVTIVTGDLNAQPGEPTITTLTDAGYIDSHLAVGNTECDPATGAGCTSGRIDDALTDMTNAESKQTERIDYVLLAPIERCETVQPTGVFEAHGGPVDQADGLVFPADHSAVEATVACRTTPADRAAGRGSLGIVSTTTTFAGDRNYR